MKEEYRPDVNETVSDWLKQYEKYMQKGGEWMWIHFRGLQGGSWTGGGENRRTAGAWWRWTPAHSLKVWGWREKDRHPRWHISPASKCCRRRLQKCLSNIIRGRRAESLRQRQRTRQSCWQRDLIRSWHRRYFGIRLKSTATITETHMCICERSSSGKNTEESSESLICGWCSQIVFR